MKRGRLRRRNTARAKKTFAKSFGSKKRGDMIRAMGCLVALEYERLGLTVDEAVALGWSGCSGDVQFTHALARQRGATHGDKSHGVPLCAGHADEAGEGSKHRNPSKRAAFELTYTLDLFAKAAEIDAWLTERGIP